MKDFFSQKEKGYNALVVEGGAMRGIFSTGVLDAFLKNNFNPFHICIGVSAGATNIAAYLAEMYQRNYKVYTDYSIRSDFINWLKFIKGSHLVDLDWLWDITIKELRLDLEKILDKKNKYYIGVTEVATGKAVYLKPCKDNLEKILKASSAIPIFYKNPIKINAIQYVDGGLADPIPVIEAYNRNAKNIIVLRSRPYDYMMKPKANILLSKAFLKGNPKLLEAIKNRPKVYQESIEFMRNAPKSVNIVEINPPSKFKTKRLTKNIDVLKEDYRHGYEMGINIINKWNTN